MPRGGHPLHRPQLAQLVSEPPRGHEWVHQVKVDGHRIGWALVGGRATLWSRRGLDWTAQCASAPAGRAPAARRQTSRKPPRRKALP